MAVSKNARRLVVLTVALPLLAVAKPLTIKEQGSFFVGGDTKSVGTGDITVNQMYVQYQVPMKGERHVPVVMVHGCCLSSKTWETTPDGRMGWAEYFVRRDRAVYLADQVSRARSGFDPTSITAVRSGAAAPGQLPSILSATHQLSWTAFRFGPRYGEAFADGQFPVAAASELYKQMIPDLNATLPAEANPTWKQMAALATKLKGAVLMGHSESGFFPEQAALIDPTGVKGIVSIEMPCVTSFTPVQLADAREDPDADHVRRSPRRCAQRSGELAAVVRRLPAVRRPAEEGRRQRHDDAPARDGHPRQQPHADAGQEQRRARGARDRLDREARRDGQAMSARRALAAGGWPR